MTDPEIDPAIDTTTRQLRPFIDEVDSIVRAGGGERAIVDAVADALRRTLAAGLDVAPAYQEPNTEHYVMYPLYIAPDESFCVACAVWNTGQITPIHDHGVWGVVGIVSGIEREESFRPGGEGANGLVVGPVEDFTPGDVTVCCTTDQDVHRVSSGSGAPCVGIHVYGGNIWKVNRRAYAADTGEISYFTSSMPLPPAIPA